ncbi:restriction endonuclease [Viridibacterium curvum]|uniref:Restriction endonuclease type IV Mrr domain-containing protein n=1 Tax=Viridibacterium curvum TaxID=1101404 RepID=A0ABP9QFJ8_9RHOO
MQQQSSGLTGITFGNSWLSAALRTLAVFVLAYVLPAFLMAGNRFAGFLQLLATVLCFAGCAVAIYRILQQRTAEEEGMPFEATVFVDDEPPPRVVRSVPAPAASAAPDGGAVPAPGVGAAPAAAMSPAVSPVAAPASLPTVWTQAALERFCIALYRFNGLRSEMVATGVPGAYRIKLFPRNSEKANALLLCEADDAVQGSARYEVFLRDMDDAGVEKGFFVAPAGFTNDVVAVARSRHVTLVDDKLMRAMLDRLPDGAKAEAIAAANGVVL